MKLLTPEQLVRKARSELVMEFPFFGSVIIHLLLKECTQLPMYGGGAMNIPTMGTDGQYLYFNPAFVQRTAGQDPKTGVLQSFDRLVGVCGHEALHVAFGHHWRFIGMAKSQQDVMIKLLATDFSINPMARDAGRNGVMRLPDDAVYPGMKPFGFPEGLSAEEYVKLLRQMADKLPKSGYSCTYCVGPMDMSGKGEGEGEDEKDGKGSGGCDGIPTIGKTPTSGEIAQAQADWRNMVEEAMQAAKNAGKVPLGLEQLIGELHRPSVNWRDVLMRFMRDRSTDDYRMFPPNRKLYGAAGLCLPSLHTEDRMGPVVFAHDMSGSTSVEGVREAFCSESVGVCEETRPREMHFLGFDTEVHSHTVFTPDQLPVSTPDMGLKGGGGTDFPPIFDYIREHNIEPACVIVLTDMYGDGWGVEPPYPVLWAATSDVVAPWGETVKVEV